ncbi:MAG: M20/M25/M40 family metallo-hydrolase [Nitrososphaeria archaeon]
MNYPDPVAFLLEILKIYSPSTKETQVSNFIYNYLKNSNDNDVFQDKANNVILKVKEGSPKIYMIGHMDTVPGELPVIYDGENIYGRGAVDAKSALSVLLHAALNLKDLPCGIKFIAVTDEERLSEGMNEILKHEEKPDYSIFGEPTGINNVAISYKGRLLIKLNFKAKPYHSSSPLEEKTAFELMIEEINNIQNKVRGLNANVTSYFDSVTAQVVKCGCGDSTNKTPADAFTYIDIRVPPRFNTFDLERILLQGQYVVEDRLEPFSTSPSNELPRAFFRGIYNVLNEKAGFVKKLGTCDGNVLRSYYDVPIIAYGPGDSKLSHTDQERISVSEYLTAIKVVERSIRELCKNRQKSIN